MSWNKANLQGILEEREKGLSPWIEEEGGEGTERVYWKTYLPIGILEDWIGDREGEREGGEKVTRSVGDELEQG